MNTTDHDEIRANVRDRYAKAARSASGCCGPASCSGELTSAATASFGAPLYDDTQLDQLPARAVHLSLGCGNPTMLASLEEGQVVLDLGSGAGIDVLLSAKRVGETGKVYGLDMTPEMIDLARQNIAEAGVTNAEILEGTLEAIPLPDGCVDVIISNCVINLSPDKGQALREAARVLRGGGRLAVSDVVLTKPLPAEAQCLVELWAGCITGALIVDDYERLLTDAGFTDVEITPTLVHDKASLRAFVDSFDEIDLPDRERLLDEVDGTIMNAFVRARRR